MDCTHCGFSNPAGAKFCGECGTRLKTVCTHCGADVPPAFKFCGECGTPVAAAAPAAPPPPPAVPMASPLFESELRLVSMLFADMQGFTAMSERHSPEEVTHVVNRCLEAMSGAVERYGGRVDKYAGDNLMAIFGAPVAHEDDAERAVRAALDIQKVIAELNGQFERELGETVLMRCGVNTGPVLAGMVGGNALHREYGVIGDAVNLAARLQTEAATGGVLVGEETYRLTRSAFQFRPRAPFHVKGKQEKVKAYDVIGERREDAEPESFGRSAPLMGRAPELTWLYDHVRAVRDGGGGRVLGIIGEAGMGKTRLLQEMRQRAQSDAGADLTWIAGRCFSYSAAIPLFLVTDITRSFFGLRPGDDEAAVRAKLRAGVAAYLPVAAGERGGGAGDAEAEALFLFGEMLGVRFEHPVLEQMDPDGRHHLLARRMRELVAGRAATGPVLLVIDDLHWADASSLELLQQLLPHLPGLPVALVFAARPDWTVPWAGRDVYRHRYLAPLGPDDQAALMDALVDGAPLPAGLKGQLIERTGGNPFFLEEVLRSLMEAGRLRREPDGWRLTEAAADLPASVQEVVLARLDRLPRPVRRVLQVASVVGRNFPYDVLKDVADAGPRLDDYLEELQRHDFIHEKAVFPEWEYLFRHAVTQEVAYNSLLSSRRREVHRQVGEAIERLYGSRLDEQLDMLAFHFHRSDDHARALRYLSLAADRARSLFLNAEAVTYYRAALERLTAAGGSVADRARLLEGMADALAPGGLSQKAEAEQAYSEALETAAGPGDHSRLAEKFGWIVHQQGRCFPSLHYLQRVAEQMRPQVEPTPAGSEERLAYARLNLAMARHALHLGAIQEAQPVIAAAQAEVAALPAAGLSRDQRQVMAACWGRQARLAYKLGDIRAAEELALQHLALAESIGDSGEVRYAYETLGHALTAGARYGEARSYLLEGLELAEKMQDGWSIGDQCQALATVAWFEGEAQEAEDWAQRAMTAAEEVSCNPIPVLRSAELLGTFACCQGQPGIASAFFGRARNWCRSNGDVTYQALATVQIGLLARTSGRPERARACVDEARALASESEDPRVPAAIHVLDGHLLADAADWAGAAAAARQAEAAMAAFAGQMAWREELTWTMVRRLQLRLVRSASRPQGEWDRSDLAAWSAALAEYYSRQPPEPPELFEQARATEEIAAAWRGLGEWGPARAALEDALALYRRLFAERLAVRAEAALHQLAQ